MADDLKKRYDAINAKAERLSEHVQAGVSSPAAAFGLSVLLTECLMFAKDAIDRIDEIARATVAATGYNPDSPGFDACVNAVKWEQKPLDCQGVEVGGKGKIEIRECEIDGGRVV